MNGYTVAVCTAHCDLSSKDATAVLVDKPILHIVVLYDSLQYGR